MQAMQTPFFKKVYFQDSLAIFAPEGAEMPSGCIDARSCDGLGNILKLFLDPQESVKIFFCEENPQDAYSAFCGMFRQVSAAGGLMQTPSGRMLLIHRRGMWDLPKGHQEKGESIEDCALREVMEETGISAERMGELICVTDHCYFRDGVWHLKHTSWFDMFCSDGVGAVPQTEEDITEAVWKEAEEVPSCLLRSYPSIKDVFALKQIFPKSV